MGLALSSVDLGNDTMTGDREHRAFRATAVFTAFNYAGIAASFVSVPLLLRWLGRENYGLMLTALAFMNYLFFADAGLNWGSIVLIGEAHGRKDQAEVTNIFRHSLVLALVSASVAAIAALGIFSAARHGWRLPMFASGGQADGLILVVALQCGVSLVTNVFYSVFQGMQEAYWTGLYQGCARLTGTVGVAVAAYFYRNPVIALSANAVAVAAFGLVAAAHIWRKYPWIMARGSLRDAAQYARQLRTGAKSFGLQIARTIQGTTPVMVIGAMIGPAAVPLYSVPVNLIGSVFGIFASWNMSLQPAYGASWAAHDRPWVVTAFRNTLNSILLLGAIAVAGFIVIAPIVVRLWTRGLLHPSRAICAAGAIVLLVQAVSGTVQSCLAGINQHRQIALIELAHTGFAILCAIAAVHFAGPAGIGIGMAVAYGATASWLGFRDLARRLGSHRVIPRKWWILRLALAESAGVAIGIGFVHLMSPAGSFAALAEAAAGSVLAAATVVAATIFFRVQSAAEWRIWATHLTRVPRQILRGLPAAEPAVAS
jgi:O-antigen/teichoic acid export membrane protein